MKLLDVLKIAYLRCDEDPNDREPDIDILMTYGINQAYKLIRKSLDKRLKIVDIPYSEKITLPNDFLSIVDIKIGNRVISDIDTNIYGYDMYINPCIIQDPSIPEPLETPGDINMVLRYLEMPADLIGDDDEVVLKFEYMDALSSYASYLYLLSQSKPDLAKTYLTEFNSILMKEER